MVLASSVASVLLGAKVYAVKKWKKWHIYKEYAYGKDSILQVMPLGSMNATHVLV
jgi:hypothetical protein